MFAISQRRNNITGLGNLQLFCCLFFSRRIDFIDQGSEGVFVDVVGFKDIFNVLFEVFQRALLDSK